MPDALTQTVTVANPVPGSAGYGKSGANAPVSAPVAGPTSTTTVAPPSPTPVVPTPTPAKVSGATPDSELPPGDSQTGPDADFYKALQALNPNDEQGYKDTLYSYYAGKSAADIQAIKDTAAAANAKRFYTKKESTAPAPADKDRMWQAPLYG